MVSRRQRKVAELLHEEISQLIQFGTNDPRLGFVTVTGVDISADLRNATVHISVFGDDADVNSTLQGLASASGYFRFELRQTLSLRHIPELKFKIDDSLERASKIEALLDSVKQDIISESTENDLPGD